MNQNVNPHENEANSQKIKLELELAELNQVLDALGRQPYASVYMLIEKLHAQAKPQVVPPAGDSEVSRLS